MLATNYTVLLECLRLHGCGCQFLSLESERQVKILQLEDVLGVYKAFTPEKSLSGTVLAS